MPIAPANQDAVSALFSNAAWQPAIPVVPPAAPQPFTLENLAGLANWANVNDKPFEFKPNKARNPCRSPWPSSSRPLQCRRLGAGRL